MRRAAASMILGLATAACAPPSSPFQDESVPTPRLFAPGIVSTDAREYGITFAPDGTEAYFTRSARRIPPHILVTRFVGGAWTEPEPAPFSGEGDEAPFLSPDGRRLVFTSRRAMPGTYDRSENLWMVERTERGWSEPVPLPEGVNRPEREIDDVDVGSEFGPLVLEGGVLLFTATADPDWGDDIYVTWPDDDGGFETPHPLRLNTYGDEANPAMSPDGRHLIFQAYRGADGYGGADLYVSERTAWGWGVPQPLPAPINSPYTDGWPRFSPDGRFFFFASDRHDPGGRGGGDPSIYYVDTAALGLHTGVR